MTRIGTLLGGLALLTLPTLGAGDEPKPPARDSVPPAASDHAEDRKAIQSLTDRFVADYNKGDAKALAGLFTPEAEVIDVDGTHYEGKDLIESLFTETFTDSPGVTIAVTPELIRFPAPNTAKEEGESKITPKEGAPLTRRYTVLYVKRDGRWLYDSVREDLEPLASPHDRLKALEWMVGDWVDESADAEVRVGCKWSDDGNYLLRDFTLKRQGEAVMKVTQRVGWDPLTKQFKSWEFDSQGGYGEALWTEDGNRWVLKQSGVLPDGRTASATRILVRENPGRVSWMSTQAVVGGEAIPDSDVYVMVKTPPSAQAKAEADPESRPSTPGRKPQ